MLNFTKNIENLEQLKKFWEDLLPLFKARTILLLNGEVGAGKTHSVKAIAEILDLKDVVSPSFAIHNRYESANGFVLDHVDLYRLKDDEDLESTGFWDLFSQAQSLVAIEWSQRLNISNLPMNWQQVEVLITITGETTRKLEVRFV